MAVNRFNRFKVVRFCATTFCHKIAASLLFGLALPAIADTPPTSPGPATAALYSGAGGEFSWNRSTDNHGVIGYEIILNGENLGIVDALSHYDPSLTAGTSYNFTVAAVDTAGQRSAVASVSIGQSAAPGSNTLAAPQGLSAVVYSDSGLELFWTRPGDPGLSFEVRRNGVFVTNTTGTSHYASGLLAGTQYRYEIITIDSSGERSIPSSITATTTGGASAAPAVPTSPGPTNTVAEILPTSISLTSYSQTAAELFWEPASLHRPVITRNEIRRDGVLIGTTPGEGARSFFDGEREPGRDYSYEITAFNANGSATAVFEGEGSLPAGPTTPPVDAGTDLPEDTLSLLAVNFEIANGEALEKITAAFFRIRNVTDVGLEYQSTEVPENFPGNELDSYACPGGGTIRSLRQIDRPVGSIATSMSALDCVVGSAVLTGSFDILPDNQNPDLAVFSINEALLIDSRDQSTTTLLFGQYYFDTNDLVNNTWFMANLVVERPDSSYSLQSNFGSGADTQSALPDGSLGQTAFAFQVEGGLGTDSTITTTGPFEFELGRADGKPTVGRLSIETSGFGNTAFESWALDAFNGDPDSFTLTVTTDESGSAIAYTIPWSDRFQVRTFDPGRVDVGF